MSYYLIINDIRQNCLDLIILLLDWQGNFMECRTGDDISSRLWEVLWESFSQAHLHAVYNLATGVLGNNYTITPRTTPWEHDTAQCNVFQVNNFNNDMQVIPFRWLHLHTVYCDVCSLRVLCTLEQQMFTQLMVHSQTTAQNHSHVDKDSCRVPATTLD